jgi:hypothetical protein
LDYPEFKYVDLAIGGVNKRNNVVDIDTVRKKLPEQPKDCYQTYFRFDDKYPEYVNTHFTCRNRDCPHPGRIITDSKCPECGEEAFNTVSGYLGQCYTDFFRLDIDNQYDPYRSLIDTQKALKILETHADLDIRNVLVFFSGAKGIHLYLPAVLFGFEPSDRLPKINRSIAEDLFGVINPDLKVYDLNRLFRIDGTIHSKTGLYKIPLEIDEVYGLSIDEIKDLAKTPRRIDFVSQSDMNRNKFLAEIYEAFKGIIQPYPD